MYKKYKIHAVCKNKVLKVIKKRGTYRKKRIRREKEKLKCTIPFFVNKRLKSAPNFKFLFEFNFICCFKYIY